MVFTVFIVVSALAVGAFFLRKLPFIAIPLGLALMVPFFLSVGEQAVRGRDNSVGAAFVPLILFVSSLVAAIGAFLFIAALLRLKPDRRWKILLGTAIAILVPAGIAFLWWSRANIDYVTRSAEQIAGNEPYCIDVASGGERKPATSLDDFSGYNMRAVHSGEMYLGPHAILAVGAGNSPALYHWSHTRKSFITEPSGPQPVYCEARRHFTDTLTNTPAVSPQSIRFGGMRLSAPDRYRLHISGATLIFTAAAPDFENAPPAQSEQAIMSFVEVNIVDSDRTDAWLSRTNSDFIVEDSGEEYGLRAQTRWSVATDGRKKPYSPSFEYFNLSDDNRVATVILCLDKVKVPCIHTFRSGGWTYTFHHNPSDLKQWKRMQDKLVELTHSFVQAPETTGRK